MDDRRDSARGWLVVVATFFGSAVTLGMLYSFGSFFDAMATDFGSGKGETAVVFGITTFAFFWLSLITGRLADRFGPRPVLAVGAAAFLVGTLATSVVNDLSLGYFTYGAGIGLAASCAYIPMVATVGGWFEAQRAAAVGVAVAGIGVGTLVMNPLATRLLESYSWRTSFRIVGISGTAILVACTFLVARAPGAAGAAHSRVAEASKSAVFRRLWVAGLCSGLALFVPFVFLVPYATDEGVSPTAASWLVALLGGASVISRVGFGALTNRFGTFRLFRFGVVLMPLSFVLWFVAGSSYAILVAFVIVLGAGYGCFVAVSPLVMAQRFGVVGLGSLLGLFYTTQGLGGLIGPPAAGRMIEATDSYRLPIALSFLVGMCAAAILYTITTTPSGDLTPESGMA